MFKNNGDIQIIKVIITYFYIYILILMFFCIVKIIGMFYDKKFIANSILSSL